MTTLETLLPTLEAHANIIDGEQLDELRAVLISLQTSLVAAREEGRNLRIAVVGQMKAGKSSFLNSAFFGRDLLPKADTPMTAALTKIVYSSKAYAEVVFYNQGDWDVITKLANEYPLRYAEEEAKLIEESKTGFSKPRRPSKSEVDRRISVSVISSVELIRIVQEKSLDVQSYLGKTEILEDVEGADALAKALQQYVGSGGRFAAITKMTVLHVDDSRLVGLDIIDTPGFNDPVVSRGQVTRKFLGQCDVIFLLSSVSQFITSSDMAVMREQLSEAGISEKAIFLVGSQRDIALRQDPNIARIAEKLAERYPIEQRAGAKVAAMMQILDKQMGEYAHKTLGDQINKSGLDEKTRLILSAINSKVPRFISAWAWLVAENLPNLSADDKDQLNKLSRDTGYTFDADSLRVLSNIPAVRDEVLQQREHKAQLIASKEQELRDGVRRSASGRLKEIRESLSERSARISNNNIAALEKAEKAMTKRLVGGRVRLESVFDEQVVKASQQFALLKTELRASAHKYSRVDTVKETKTESYEVDTSFFGGFFGSDWETRYRDVVTVYASAQDAIERVEDFAIKSTKALQRSIIECVDLEALKRNVGKAAMDLFDTSSADFDGEMMLAEVNKSLRRIIIPDVSFGNKDYSGNIVKAFGSDRVTEDNINGLKKAQRVAVAAVIADIEGEVDLKVKEIERRLCSEAKTFVDTMSRDIQVSLTTLRADIATKEETISQINQALKTVDTCLAAL